MNPASLLEGKPKIAFADFWPNFDLRRNILSFILQTRLNAVLEDDPSHADVLIYSVFGDSHRSFRGTKVFYTGESLMPLWNECDYALTFMRDGSGAPERHFRLPHWMFCNYILNSGRIEQFPNDSKSLVLRHRKFCNFVYSNGKASERILFLKTLSRYRHVDCAGKCMNNMGISASDKLEFCSGYKFTIAFENYPSRGYVTEKLTDALAAGSLPIYWGAPDVIQDFNPRRFVHARDFRNFDELSDYIRYLDQNEEAYLSYFREPIFTKGQMNIGNYKAEIEAFFRHLISTGSIRATTPGPPFISEGFILHNYPMMPRYDDGKPWLNEVKDPGLPSDASGEKPFRIAACISSYKRVEDFLRQILCMMHQSYPHLHVFAALKGVPPSVAEELVFPYVQPFIDAKKLTLRLFPNKDQLSNFLDTVKDIDISGYDLFAKIDDDDFYCPDYMRHISDFHATLPEGYSSWYRAGGHALKRSDGIPILCRTNPLCTGAAQVMSARIIQELLILEKNPGLLTTMLEKCRRQTGFGSIGFAEDQLFKSLMIDYGCGNIAPFLERRGIRQHLIIQHSNSSVMRGGMLSQEFRQCNRIPNDEINHELIVDLIHDKWTSSARLFQGRAKRLDNSQEEADIVSSSPLEISLKWDHWGTETFTQETPGRYRLQQ